MSTTKAGAKRTHGMSHTPSHDVWCDLKQTTRLRGIPFHETWKKSFITFYNEVGTRPSAKHFLVLKDPDLGYIPGNASWKKLKSFHRIPHYDYHNYVTYNGQEIMLCDLADKIGISQKLLRVRIFKYNWPVEKACELWNFKTNQPLPKKPTY